MFAARTSLVTVAAAAGLSVVVLASVLNAGRFGLGTLDSPVPAVGADARGMRPDRGPVVARVEVPENAPGNGDHDPADDPDVDGDSGEGVDGTVTGSGREGGRGRPDVPPGGVGPPGGVPPDPPGPPPHAGPPGGPPVSPPGEPPAGGGGPGDPGRGPGGDPGRPSEPGEPSGPGGPGGQPGTPTPTPTPTPSPTPSPTPTPTPGPSEDPDPPGGTPPGGGQPSPAHPEAPGSRASEAPRGRKTDPAAGAPYGIGSRRDQAPGQAR